MDALTYRVLHLIGVVLLFSGLGAALLGAVEHRKKAMIASGTGLLFLLVAGFGSLAKLNLGFPGWVWVKLVIWLVMGVLPVLVKKGKMQATAAWVVAILLGSAAAYLGVMKPF